MNKLKISLSTTYDIEPSHLQIECLGDVIHDGELTKNLVIEHESDRSDLFEIKIRKTGKTKKIVDMNGTQEVIVQSINLNGIDLKNKEFGSFSTKDNAFMDDEILQTNQLNLNGEWTLELPTLNLVGDISKGKIRDQFSDSEIACFGCSQTYGAFLEHDEAWPGHLERLTGKLVKNYYKKLIGSTFLNEKNVEKKMNEEDILVVAPYNVQVNYLKSILPKIFIILDLSLTNIEYLKRARDF